MAVDYKELKKGGFMRQRQKDHFSMRLKSVGGHFTAAQLGTVQKVAEQYGKGYVHLTSRQGIEIPFIRLEDIDAVKKALHEGGVSVGVCGPRVRTALSAPFSATRSLRQVSKRTSPPSSTMRSRMRRTTPRSRSVPMCGLAM